MAANADRAETRAQKKIRLQNDTADAEKEITFDKKHYGKEGLNGRFFKDIAVDTFAGSKSGGGGRFEDVNKRDIAREAKPIIEMLQKHAGLTKHKSIIADIGAGTGLFLNGLSKTSKRVVAVELSPVFCDFLKDRAKTEGLDNIEVVQSTDKDVNLGDNSIDIALCVDVYHHFLFPKTACTQIRKSLKSKTSKFVVIDFHRDPSKMTEEKHKGKWALEHIRADQDTFRAEIENCGFKSVSEPKVDGLSENYVMIFSPC